MDKRIIINHFIKVNIVVIIACLFGLLVNLSTPMIAIVGTIIIFIVANLSTAYGFWIIKRNLDKN